MVLFEEECDSGKVKKKKKKQKQKKKQKTIPPHKPTTNKTTPTREKRSKMLQLLVIEYCAYFGSLQVRMKVSEA